MSRARDLADLLDASGDVKSAALDNVPASNDASALTTGTLPAARIAAGSLSTSKISGLHTVATSGAYSDISGTPNLHAVATSGAYADVTGTPSLASVATSGDYNSLSNRPTINTYTAGNGLSLNGTQFNLGGNAVKQHIMSQPNVGILSKSGGWQEVHTSMRVSIACTSGSSRLLIRYTFTFGGNNSSQLAAFKIRDITGNFDVNMNSWQNRSASHGTTRHRDHDVNDCEQLVVAAVVEAGQTSTSARTYTLYFKNEGNGGTTKYFNGWAQNLSQGFYSKPICEIMEL